MTIKTATFKVMTSNQRTAFMQAYGAKFAGFGGTFGAFRDAESAFAKAKDFHPYAAIGITDSDFAAFQKGYVDFQKFRIALQLAAKDAQKVMHDILLDIEIPSPSKDAKHYTDLAGWQKDNPDVTPAHRAEMVQRGMP